MGKKNFTAEEVEKILNTAKMMDIISLNMLANIKCDDENNVEIGDMLIDRSPGPAEILEENERRKNLLKYVNELSPREIKVIKLRYGLEDGRSKTLEEVSNIYGLTRERIRQIEMRAIAKLKWRITVKDKLHDIDDF